MKLIIGFLVLLSFCGCNSPCTDQTKEPTTLVELLSNPDQNIRAEAAATLRRLIGTNSSLKTNNHGEKYWKKRVESVTPGMRHSDVIKILPAYNKTLSADRLLWSGSGSGDSHIGRWRLDHYWIVMIQYRNPDRVIETPKLQNKAMRVWVKPPKGFSGTWITWYINGFKDHVIEYKNDKYNGAFIVFYDNGHKSYQQHYKAGVCSGPSLGWYTDGRKMYNGNYINNKQTGTWTHWFPDGRLRSRCKYKNGKYHGVQSVWYDNGKMQSKVSYQNGKKHGLDRTWNKSGKLLWSRYYENGKLRRLMQQSRSTAQVQTQDNATVTLKGMICHNFTTQKGLISYPSVCANVEGDWRSGRSEVVFVKKSNPRLLVVHAVFQKSLAMPKSLNKTINLQGYFQRIKVKEAKKLHKRINNYKYFVVTSWEYQK